MPIAKPLVYINGQIVAPKDARISIFDRGFLYGDSVFETMRVYGGEVFALSAHLHRLHRSGELIGFTLPWSPDEVQGAVADVLGQSGLADAYLRVIATRGQGPLGLYTMQAEDPQLIVIVQPLPELPDELYSRGRSALMVSVRRTSAAAIDPRAKTGNYINNILALQEANGKGAQEAIMLDPDGRVAEASTANIFAHKEGVWMTPPLEVGILGGITRETLIELCVADGVAVKEQVLWPDDLREATEILLCSSVRELVPIVTLDGNPVGDGLVGERYKALLTLYRDNCRSV